MVDKNETRRNTEYESIESLFFDGQTYCIIRNKQPLDSTNAMMQRSPKHHVGIYRYKERVLIGVLHHTPSSFFAHLL